MNSDKSYSSKQSQKGSTSHKDLQSQHSKKSSGSGFGGKKTSERSSDKSKKEDEDRMSSESHLFKLNYPPKRPDSLSSQEGFFFNPPRNHNESEGFFNLGTGDSQGLGDASFNFLKKSTKSEAKVQSTYYEQNNRKYKEILESIYNKDYCKNIRTSLKDEDIIYRKPPKLTTLDSHNKTESRAFQATRIVFNKQNKSKGIKAKDVYEQYLLKKVNKHKEIYIYEMKNLNYKSLKPLHFSLRDFDNTNSFEYDLLQQRLFYFDNVTQEIVIAGLKRKEILCRVKIQYERRNPLLFYHRAEDDNQYLMVIGGFEYKGEQIIEGSRYIEVYEVKKWQISLKPLILTLNVGRIKPIVFSCEQNGESCVFILGGNSNAFFNKNEEQQMTFKKDSDDLNSTTNQTGVYIETSFIIESFEKQNNNIFLLNNLNIRFDNPLRLYNGCVLSRKLLKEEKLELFLQGMMTIFKIKILKKDIHILESELLLESPITSKKLLRMTIGYHKANNDQSPFCRINSKGQLKQLKAVTKISKKEKTCCLM